MRKSKRTKTKSTMMMGRTEEQLAQKQHKMRKRTKEKKTKQAIMRMKQLKQEQEQTLEQRAGWIGGLRRRRKNSRRRRKKKTRKMMLRIMIGIGEERMTAKMKMQKNPRTLKRMMKSWSSSHVVAVAIAAVDEESRRPYLPASPSRSLTKAKEERRIENQSSSTNQAER